MIRLTDHSQTRQILRQLRRAQGLTQATLGQATHVTTKAISYRENGHRDLHISALIDTAKALGFIVALLPDRGRRTTGTGWPT